MNFTLRQKVPSCFLPFMDKSPSHKYLKLCNDNDVIKESRYVPYFIYSTYSRINIFYSIIKKYFYLNKNIFYIKKSMSARNNRTSSSTLFFLYNRDVIMLTTKYFHFLPTLIKSIKIPYLP